MNTIVTLDEMKTYLRVDDHEEDNIIDMLLTGAIEAVADAIGSPIVEPAPARVKIAIMTHVARVWCEREDGADLPPSAVRLLFPLRKLDI